MKDNILQHGETTCWNVYPIFTRLGQKWNHWCLQMIWKLPGQKSTYWREIKRLREIGGMGIEGYIGGERGKERKLMKMLTTPCHRDRGKRENRDGGIDRCSSCRGGGWASFHHLKTVPSHASLLHHLDNCTRTPIRVMQSSSRIAPARIFFSSNRKMPSLFSSASR